MGWQGRVPSGGFTGEFISLPFSATKACILWLVAPSTSFQPLLLVTSPSLTLTLLSLSFPYMDCCNYIGPTLIIQDNLPILKSLT